MVTAQCDKKGRLYLRESIRSTYGERFRIVEANDRLILIPIPEDPVAELERLGQPIRRLSLRSLKKSIRDAAKREVEA